MSKLMQKITFLGVILQKIVNFTKILILGRKIFKTQNFNFFFKIQIFAFDDVCLRESDNFDIKSKKRIENQELKKHQT